MDTKAFRKLSYGLYVISTLDQNGHKIGCIANTFQQVANDPLCVSVALHKDNTTTQVIEQTGCFVAVSLSIDAGMELIGRFGFNSSYNIDKFDGLESLTDTSGVPYITESINARFSVDVIDHVDVGSHVLFIGKVKEAETLSNTESLTYDYYHRVLRGKTPPKAVSFNTDTAEQPATTISKKTNSEIPESISANNSKTAPDNTALPKVAWRCTLCGYVEEGYPDGLPEDYRCPWCGAGPEFFERIEL